MEVKYHINNNGDVGICKAKKGACPFGGDENHFSNEQDAYKAAQELNESMFGIAHMIESENLESENAIKENSYQENESLFGISEMIENEHVITRADVAKLRSKIAYIFEEKGLDSDDVLSYSNLVMDSDYIKFTSRPEMLHKLMKKESDNILVYLDKAHEVRKEHMGIILEQVDSIEAEYNGGMKNLISKEVTKTTERSSELSGKLGGELGIDISTPENLPSAKVKAEIGGTAKKSFKSSKVTKEEVGLSSRDKRKNKKTAEQRENTERAKSRRIDEVTGKRLNFISELKDNSSKYVDGMLGKGAGLIRDPEKSEKASELIGELNKLHSNVYISEKDGRSLTYQFREAERTKDEVAMRSCNRIADIFEDRSVVHDDYVDKGANAVLFEENYKKLESGKLFTAISRQEFQSNVLEVRANLMSYFDVSKQ